MGWSLLARARARARASWQPPPNSIAWYTRGKVRTKITGQHKLHPSPVLWKPRGQRGELFAELSSLISQPTLLKLIKYNTIMRLI